jgi:hypothetical protein
MSTLSKQQLDVENQTSFPNNTTGFITPVGLRTFNTDMIDSTVNQTTYNTESASFDVRIDNLDAWSSSLANTIATKLDTSSFNSYTQSTATTFNQFSSSTNLYTQSINTYTQSTNAFTASISSSVALLSGSYLIFSGTQYKADSSSFDSRITNIIVGSGLVTTASFNAYTSSVSSSNYITSASFDSRIDYIVGAYAITGSNTFSGSQIINGYLQSNTLYVTGSITASSYSGSVNGIGNVTDYSTSVNSRITINSQSAWGAFQSASAYSASAVTTYAQLAVANNYTANQTITGSAKGKVAALSVASSTASLDCSSGNFFTLTIPASTVTLINPTNIQAGQTVGVLLTQNNPTGSVRWPSNCKFSSGSAAFTGSAIANAIDLVTFVSFDTTNLYMGGVKNLV